MRPAVGDGAPIDPAAEATTWTGRTHWQSFMLRIAGGVLLIAGAWWCISWLASRNQWSGRSTLLTAAIVSLAIILGLAVSILYHILLNGYRLTGQRLFISHGIISQTIDQLELIRVDDVRVRKSLLDRVFGLGTVEIRSTDTTHPGVQIQGVKDADSVAELVRTSMRTLRSRSLFVENL